MSGEREDSGPATASTTLASAKSGLDFKQQAFWSKFLKYLNEGLIVPIIGDELLQVTTPNGQVKTLDSYLCELFLESFADDLEEVAIRRGEPMRNLSLTEAVSLHRKAAEIDGEVCELYRTIHDQIAIPEPLLQLARIESINLFLSTTADDLLERALNETRFGGESETRVLFYSPKHVPENDEIEKALQSGRPVVFQLFGTYKDARYVAVTDAHFVEYVKDLLSGKRPERLFDELVNVSIEKVKHLLLLGNHLPGWLVRFFLRVARNEAFPNNSKNLLYISDSALQGDLFLPRFIDRFAPSTKILPDLSPIRFVAELSKRWQQTCSAHPLIHKESRRSEEAPELSGDTIFLSYAHEDARAAHELRTALENRGLPVWMDRGDDESRRLNPGDPYDKKIQECIAECVLFIAVISHHAAEPSAGYLRREWSCAIARLPDYTGLNKSLIVPVVIDNVDFYKAQIPPEFKKIQYQSLPAGKPTDEFSKWIQTLYRDLKSRKRL